jgi:hypothetical protein
MAKKFVKGLLMIMVVVLAIVVQAGNPSFSHLSLNHPSSLTPFPHSALIIFLYPRNDAKHQLNRSKKKKILPRKKKILIQ